MNGIKVLAKNAEEAIVRIRETAVKEKRGVLYVVVKRYFWWLFWILLCLTVAALGRSPAAAGIMLAVPVGLKLAIRFLRTAPGLVAVAALLAWAAYLGACQFPKVHHFLDVTTYKFVSGSGAIVVPHSKDVVRLYAQDDFYIGDYLKKTGQTVRPGERLLVADLSREVKQLMEMQQSLQPKEAHTDYLLAENRRKREEAKLQLKLNDLRQQQVAFETRQFEKPSTDGLSMMEAHRKLLEKRLISQTEFAALEKSYEQLKSEQQRLAVQRESLDLDVSNPAGTELFDSRYALERAQVDQLRYRTESNREWLKRVAFVSAPTGESNAFLTQLLREPEGLGRPARAERPARPEPAPGATHWDKNQEPSPKARKGAPRSLAHLSPSVGDRVPWSYYGMVSDSATDLDARQFEREHFASLGAGDGPRDFGGHYYDPRGPDPDRKDNAQDAQEWQEGEIIYLAGSRSSSQVRRGELVAEIWKGEKRKRIGLALPRAKMVGIDIGTPVNFLLDEEVGDFDSVVYGKIVKIRQYPDQDTFWIEAGDLAVMGQDKTLADYPLGLSGNYRIGLRPVTHKEKYLKVKGEARDFRTMCSSVWRYLANYARHMAGEDFVPEPPKDSPPPPDEKTPAREVFHPIAKK